MGYTDKKLWVKVFNYCSSTAQTIAKTCFLLDEFSNHSSYSDMNKQLKVFTWITSQNMVQIGSSFWGNFIWDPHHDQDDIYEAIN